ncbi:MAG: GvpL/GvpF family gas vesicle protein [Bacteroidetes bacterium]|nr:GvpL/GvpF family gas vesicle protein [Bacteroidota bacterium]
MENEGKYIYCIIPTKHDRKFGPIGIGGRGDEVMTIGYEGLAVVASSHPMSKFVVNRENLLAHETVIEEVMKEYESVLPVRFGTIATTTDVISNLLIRRYRELNNLSLEMRNLIELGVKGIWTNMSMIFKEIEESNNNIKIEVERVRDLGGKDSKTIEKIGKMIKDALPSKKNEETERIVEVLKEASYDYRVNSTSGDEYFMNGAFLISKGREKEFDNLMDDLCKEYDSRIRFKYTGPLPVYNFMNIAIYPEEWEK